jgi:pSer/pThr/pTyr-binding forkhead associated (FHA) protein
MQAVLVMFRSDGDRRSFSLTRDITVIGRREDCDLRIPLGDISRKHCRLVRDGDSLRLEDLGSSNGTYHNGKRVQEAILSPGDSVQVGPLVFVLQVDGVPADEELSPAPAESAEAREAAMSAGIEDDGPLMPTAQSDLPLPQMPGAEAEFDPMDALEPGDAMGTEIESMDELEALPLDEDDNVLEALPDDEQLPLDSEHESQPHH